MTADSGPTTGIGRWLPILDWLPRYQPSWLRYDGIAALTVWAVVVPQAIAYAQIAGLPPEAGLVAAMGGLLAYGILGTSRQLVVSPTSSTAAISAAIITPLAMGDADRFAALSATLAIGCGIALVVFGWLKMGFLSRFIPTAVQAGFMVGLGLTIIVGQLPKLLGTPAVSGDFLAELEGLLPTLGQMNGWTVAIGLGSLAMLLVLHRLAPALPAALIAVVLSIAAVELFDLVDKGVAVLGAVEGGLPIPAIPAVGLADIAAILPGALAIAIIGTAEALTIAERFADEHRYEIRPDQELVANGGANVLSGFLQGFMVGGGASQSAANDSAGARTPLSSLIVAVLVLATMLFLLPLFANLPQAVLAAIVIAAVAGFVEATALRRIWSLRRDAFVLALVALAGVLLLGVLPGLLIAVVASIGLVLGKLARPTGDRLGRVPGVSAFVAMANHPDAEPVEGVLVYRLNAPLVALNAKRLRRLVDDEIRADGESVRAVVLDLGATSELDIATIDMFEGLHRDLKERNLELALGNVVQAVREMLVRSGLETTIGADRIHRDLADAVASVASPARAPRA
jgi:high affinity sulfate transporter 1